MSSELIKKAYEYHQGVWPCGDDESIIVSTSKNSKLGSGVYRHWGMEKRHFLALVKSENCESWQWVGAKADFDEYGESLKAKVDWDNAPEGAVYYHEGSEYNIEHWVNSDGLVCHERADGWIKLLGKFPLNGVEYIERPVEQKWTPEVGQECEYPSGRGIVKLPPDTNGILIIEEDGIYKRVAESGCRPLKTESEKQADAMFDIVKDATDLYHACELLVKEGYRK